MSPSPRTWSASPTSLVRVSEPLGDPQPSSLPRLTPSRPHGTARAMSDEPPSQKMWGGRFSGQPSELMRRINASIGFDKRLWREDIAGSTAHAAMLRERGIIDEADAAAILEGLDQIAAEYERDG